MMLYSMNLKRPGRKTNMYIYKKELYHDDDATEEAPVLEKKKTFQNRFVKKNEAAKTVHIMIMQLGVS